jgi:hypothetical protein
MAAVTKTKPLTVKCFFFCLVCEAIGTAATTGLLCQPRVIVKMIVEKQMECRLAGETEVLGENLPSQNPTWPDPGLNPGRRGGKPATNRLSYGAASVKWLVNNYVARSPSREDDSRTADQEIPHLLKKLKIHCRLEDPFFTSCPEPFEFSPHVHTPDL